MSDIDISIQNITKLYPVETNLLQIFTRPKMIQALKNISFNVYKQDIFGILGPNGAGKTTLIKILASLILPDAGQVRILDYNLFKSGFKIKSKVGIITGDERGFYWRLSAKQNLIFFGTLMNLAGPQLKKKVNDLLEYVGLQDSANIMFKEFSSGMRTRLQLARALLTEPDILLLDEPTKSLDIEGIEKFRRLLKEPILGKKMTVILATHSLEEAEAVCNRFIILKKGEKIIEGNIEDIRNFLNLDNHINVSISSRNPESLKASVKKIKELDSIVSISEDYSVSSVSLNINYKEKPIQFLEHMLDCCKDENCEIDSLSVNSKDLRQVLHQVLDIKKDRKKQ